MVNTVLVYTLLAGLAHIVNKNNLVRGSVTTVESEIVSESALPTLDQEVIRYLDSVDKVDINIVDSSVYRHYPGTESDNFDYNNERYGIHKTTFSESIAHMIKGAMGAGVMTMHEAFMYGGLWTALGMIFFIGFLNTYTMHMLSKSAHLMYNRLRVTRLSYPDLAEVAVATGAWRGFRKFSKQFRYTVDVSIVLYMCGTCCIYQIMIANTFRQALEEISTKIREWLYDDIRLYILINTPILYFLCVIKSLKILAPFSMIADIFVAVCVLATLYYSSQTQQPIADRPAWKDMDSFLKYYGMCMYSTCGIAVCLPIENNMRHPKQFSIVLKWGMGIVVVLMAITGFFGYWGWGENCRSPINVHMPPNIFTGILQFLLAIMLCVTFVVQFWVACKIIWYYVIKRCRADRRCPRHRHSLLERIFRLLFTTLVTCVSILLPNLIPIMTFMGLFILGFINFVFPAFIESLITFKQDQEAKIRWRVLKNVILILFGVLMSASSFYSIIRF